MDNVRKDFGYVGCGAPGLPFTEAMWVRNICSEVNLCTMARTFGIGAEYNVKIG